MNQETIINGTQPNKQLQSLLHWKANFREREREGNA